MATQQEVEQAVKAIALHVKNELSSLESKLEKLSVPAGIEEKLAKIDEVYESLKGLEEEMSERYSEEIDDIRHEVSKLSKEIDEREEEHTKFTENLIELRRQITEVKTKKAPVPAPDLAKTIEQIKSELTKKLSEAPAKELAYLEEALEELRTEIAELKESKPSKTYELVNELSSLKEHVNELQSQLDERLEKIKLEETHAPDERFGELESFVKKELARIDASLKGVTQQDLLQLQAIKNELEQKLKEADEFTKKTSGFDTSLGQKLSTLDASLNKKMSEADTKLADLGAKVNQRLKEFDTGMEERIKKIEAADVAVIHKRIDKLEGEVEARNLLNMERRLATLEDETKKLEEIRKLLEDEGAFRVALEKRMSDSETKMSNVEKAKPARFEADITPIIARRLEEFSHALDRKFPELMTRDEFERFSADVNNKLRYIEAPNVEPIEKRLEVVEKNLSDLNYALRKMLDRMPVVVE